MTPRRSETAELFVALMVIVSFALGALL